MLRAKVLMSGENKEYITMLDAQKMLNAKNEKRFDGFGNRRRLNTSKNVMSGVIRGRGANGAPKFFQKRVGK